MTPQDDHHKLERLEIRGFKSIRDATIEFRGLNVLIGANGSGKSNLLSVFHMLSYLTAGRLQTFVRSRGNASSLLHYGPKRTPQVSVEATFRRGQDENQYSFRLAHGATDSLFFADERVTFHSAGHANPDVTQLGFGHVESKLEEAARSRDAARVTRAVLRECGVYHFHDTSHTAAVRLAADIEESTYLRTDGRNLAPFLLRLRSQHEPYYRRIVETIKLVAPFFEDFVLESATENPRQIFLRWRDKDKDKDATFGPHLLSDGTLRAMCLVTTLLQPDEYRPNLIVLDEPELGLHPYGIEVIGGLIKATSLRSQIIVATQSPQLVNMFDAADVIVVERHGGESEFRRVDVTEFKAWLDEYTVAELWEKNVIGGRPSAWSS